jgi:succinate dehydrogenase subunit C
MNVRLYLWQRGTAALLAPMLLVHLAIIFYATQHGLSAAAIMARTRGSVGWLLFYGLFVLAAAIHAAIGVRNVLCEWSPLGERNSGVSAVLFGLVLLALGWRAVAAVVFL